MRAHTLLSVLFLGVAGASRPAAAQPAVPAPLAPASGDDSSAVTVPGSVNVPGGEMGASVTVATGTVTASTTVTITGSFVEPHERPP